MTSDDVRAGLGLDRYEVRPITIAGRPTGSLLVVRIEGPDNDEVVVQEFRRKHHQRRSAVQAAAERWIAEQTRS